MSYNNNYHDPPYGPPSGAAPSYHTSGTSFEGPSHHPYPHQPPLDSDTVPMSIPSPHPTGTASAQSVQDGQLRQHARDEDLGDLSTQSSRPVYGYEYDNAYEGPSQSQPHSLKRAPSSVGPWDSASQRDVPIGDDAGSVPRPYTHQALSDTPSRHIPNKPSYAGGLSYIDEEGAYYRSDSQRPASAYKHDDVEMRGLMSDPGEMGGQESGNKIKFTEYETSPMPYPAPDLDKGQSYGEPSHVYNWLLFPTGLDRLLALFGVSVGSSPPEQAAERKRRGVPGQRWPVAAWTLTAVMCGIMAYELVRNHSLTGSVIATKPTFNYMIGPSPSVLINIGARFPPCMKLVPDIPPSFQLACLNDTSNPPTSSCSLEDICGHGGFHGEDPDQSFRFVLPIFLHVGLIHLALNMIAQVLAAAQVEREMGTVPFLIVYFAGGIYGFVLGGNFSRTGIPSVGASGALFATNACVLVDLCLHWKYEYRPKLKAFLLFIEFVIGFGIGYIPNAVDGLAHLGGWAMGILCGIILYPSISETKRHKYTVWALRAAAVPLIVLAFVLTIKNFYTDDPNAACEWCRYLSCIPTSSNGQCKGTGLTTTSSTTRRSRDLL